MDRDKIFEENYNLVAYVVNTYFPKNFYKDDLKQEGYLGLLKAIETYDESKNVKFSTYATKCIKNKIIDYLRKDKLVKIPIELIQEGIYNEKTIPLNTTEYGDLESVIMDEKTDNMVEKIAIRIDDLNQIEKIKKVVLDYIDSIENEEHKEMVKCYIVNALSSGKRNTMQIAQVYNKSMQRTDAIIYEHVTKLKEKLYENNFLM